jgi:hypothetical protein
VLGAMSIDTKVSCSSFFLSIRLACADLRLCWGFVQLLNELTRDVLTLLKAFGIPSSVYANNGTVDSLVSMLYESASNARQLRAQLSDDPTAAAAKVMQRGESSGGQGESKRRLSV